MKNHNLEIFKNLDLFKKLLNFLPNLQPADPDSVLHFSDIAKYYQILEFHGEVYFEKIKTAYANLKMINYIFADFEGVYALDSIPFSDIDYVDMLLQVDMHDIFYAHNLLKKIAQVSAHTQINIFGLIHLNNQEFYQTHSF